MSDDGWNPEIVVGIDFGMTCTGWSSSSFPVHLKIENRQERC